MAVRQSDNTQHIRKLRKIKERRKQVARIEIRLREIERRLQLGEHA